VKSKKMINPLIHLLIEATTRMMHVNQMRKQWSVNEEWYGMIWNRVTEVTLGVSDQLRVLRSGPGASLGAIKFARNLKSDCHFHFEGIRSEYKPNGECWYTILTFNEKNRSRGVTWMTLGWLWGKWINCS
jgi:hypothetical protein